MSRFLIPLLAVGILSGCNHEAPTEEAPAPTATVKVASLKRGTVEEPLSAYGTVAAEPGRETILSVPYECVVAKTFVVPGQAIRSGEPVAEISASNATALSLDQAKSALKTAETDLAQVKERYKLKLATNSDLNLAQRAADDARLQLESLERSGAAEALLVKSPVDGVVVALTAQAGQTVAAGTPLANIVGKDAVEVSLNVEPSDLDALEVGGEVRITPVDQPVESPISGKVRMIAASVNPTSRLVNVFVTLPAEHGLLLGGFVRADFSRKSQEGWIVPIDALNIDSIFAVRDGKAVECKVEIGLRNDEVAEIQGEGLTEGENIVVEGNHELEDGMAVEIEK